MMGVSATKNVPGRLETPDAAEGRWNRIPLILSLALLGLAGAYFGSLYLITH
jgi:hypothetical protein